MRTTDKQRQCPKTSLAKHVEADDAGNFPPFLRDRIPAQQHDFRRCHPDFFQKNHAHIDTTPALNGIDRNLTMS
jgi:hypothetical protein